MSTNNRQVLDVRALATAGLATALQTVETDIRAMRTAGNADRIERALNLLNDVADLLRDMHA